MEQNINLIQKVISEPICQVEVIENGFHSIAYIINNKFVFRFPRSQEFYQEYKNETLILEQLKPFVSVQIPSLKIHQEKDVLFTEHAYIAGIQYSQLSQPLCEHDKDTLAHDLAVFLSQIHNVRLSNIPYLPDEHQFNEEMVQNSPVLTNEEKTKCLILLDSYRQYSFSEQDVVLCHTDLNENNFLLNNNKLVGIIDFGNACQRNVSTEFSTLLKYDYDLTFRIVKYYQSLTGRKIDMMYAVLFQKLRCFDGIIENQNNVNQINRYRRWIRMVETAETFVK